MNRAGDVRADVEAYLAARRAMGVMLGTAGRQLRRFARWADARGHRGPLTTELVVHWAQDTPTVTRVGTARRLNCVRTFARWLIAIKPRTEVPPAGILGPSYERKPPHVLTEREVSTLMRSAAQLRPRGGLRPQTLRTIIGLLASTGLRPQEALSLDRGDVDLDAGHLVVRETKFHKSRLVPIHETTRRALRSYARRRDLAVARPRVRLFFLFEDGTGVTSHKFKWAFRQIRRALPARLVGRALRPYDLRHTFACRRLLTWHEDRGDVQAALPALSTYLGHACVTNTYWYLTGVPELFAACGERFEKFASSMQEARR